jgi:para-nitrobenzyl esterase
MTSDNSITVATTNGELRGRNRDGSTVFYAIPYAEAPIGPLAFEAPVRRAAWKGVRDATMPGATAQVRGFDGTIPEPSVAGDDILTVNVFTPDPSARASLPVLVWIHGGAYIAGSPTSPWYDGASFNREGVVVVTVGYRLGVAGFGLVEDAPANRGVLDWLAALEWVQENIAAFGGDPRRVTIAGQSAGGGAVLTLLGTPGVESLAHQAIAMSPVTGLVSTVAARKAIDEVARQLNVEPTAAALGALPRDTLANAPWLMHNVFGAAPGRADSQTDPVVLVRNVLDSLELSPTLDGDTVRRPLIEALHTAEGRKIPLVIGSVAQEFNTLTSVTTTARTTDEEAIRSLGYSAAAAAEYTARRSGLGGAMLLGQALTDLLIRAPVAQIAEGRERTWMYDFAWPSRGSVDPGVAFHCLDIPFAWATSATPEALRVTGDAPDSLTRDVHGAWLAFIRQGEPGWQPYTSNRDVRCFDEISTTSTDAYAAERVLAE